MLKCVAYDIPPYIPHKEDHPLKPSARPTIHLNTGHQIPQMILAVYRPKQRYPDHACSTQIPTMNASKHTPDPDSDHQPPKRKFIAT